MSLPPFSKKVLSEIASGTRHPNGKKKVPVEVLSAKRADQRDALNAAISQSRMSGKVVDKVFGKERDKAYWKEQADKWFSQFIRLRDSDEHGIATCITSGRRAHWKTMDCGHYLSRAKEGTRYDERNCHAQAKQANRFQGGHFMEHGFRIEEKYGRGTVHALEQKAMQPCKRTLEDYKFLATTYKERVEYIRKVEPGKFSQ